MEEKKRALTKARRHKGRGLGRWGEVLMSGGREVGGSGGGLATNHTNRTNGELEVGWPPFVSLRASWWREAGGRRQGGKRRQRRVATASCRGVRKGAGHAAGGRTHAGNFQTFPLSDFPTQAQRPPLSLLSRTWALPAAIFHLPTPKRSFSSSRASGAPFFFNH
jgi:hypothetical protein